MGRAQLLLLYYKAQVWVPFEDLAYLFGPMTYDHHHFFGPTGKSGIDAIPHQGFAQQGV
jgi:hypothetical protein